MTHYKETYLVCFSCTMINMIRDITSNFTNGNAYACELQQIRRKIAIINLLICKV